MACLSRNRFFGITSVGLGLFLVASLAGSQTEQSGETVAIDTDDLGGVVTGTAGPEAGVWVIAETLDFDTKFRKIVVGPSDGCDRELDGVGCEHKAKQAS